MQSRVDEAVEFYKSGKGFNCAQAVFSTYCEDYGLDKESALKLSCALGGGVGKLGQICGAVSGACLVIGLKYGKFLEDDMDSKDKTYELVHEFGRKFTEKNKTLNCSELLQIDLKNGDKDAVKQRTQEVCPRMVRDATEILESLL